MKKILFIGPLMAGMLMAGALQAHADPLPNDLIRSTPTITVMTCDFAVATPVITNSPAMRQRTTFAVQNISTANIWLKFDATVNIANGWLLPPGASISVPIASYSALLGVNITPYCIAEGAPAKIAVLEAF